MRPFDAAPQPALVVTALADLTGAGLAVGLACWLRLPDDPVGAWSALGVSSLLGMGGAEALLLLVARLRRQTGTAVLLGAIIAAVAVGWVALVAVGASPPPRGLVATQAILMIVFATTWRAAWGIARRPDRPSPGDVMVAPCGSPGPFTIVRQHRTLLYLLVARDLKLKYRGSVVGFFWSLANPLVMTGTYTLAFTYIFPVRSEGFVFLLLLGILAWNFIAGSVSMATGAIVDSGSLVRSVYFPRLILPLATVLFTFTQYLLALVVLLPFMYLVYGMAPGWSLLGLPLLLGLLALFALGLSLLMAAATAAYRDVRHLLDISLQVLFWATPILYSPSQFPREIGALILLSPVAPFIETARALLYARTWPDPAVATLVVVYTVASVVIGMAVFLHHEGRFAE